MIWADRVGLVLMVPVLLLGFVQAPGAPIPWTWFATVVGLFWFLLRGLHFIATGNVRSRPVGQQSEWRGLTLWDRRRQ